MLCLYFFIDNDQNKDKFKSSVWIFFGRWESDFVVQRL